MKYNITLIHGTFDKKAKWITKDSDFANGLAASLNAEANFDEFRWSGTNNKASRLAASEELYIRLKSQLTQNSSVRKVIIAHSHGGNVALYALKKLGKSAQNFELVTLATPFLHASIRKHLPRPQDMANGMAFFLPILIYTIFLFLTLQLTDFKYLQSAGTIPKLVEALIFTVPPVASFIWAMVRANKFKALFDSFTPATELLKEVDIDDLPTELRVHALIDNRDEVKWWFNFWYQLWELIFLLFSFYFRIARFIGSLVLSAVAVAIVSGLLSLWQADLLGFSARAQQMIPILGIIYISIPFAAFVLSTVMRLLRNNILFLGKAELWEQLCIRIEPGPTLRNQISFSMTEKKLGFFSHKGLRHSAYASSEMVSDISNWLRQNRLRNQAKIQKTS